MEEKELVNHFLATRTEEAFCALFEALCVRLRRYFLLRGLTVATAEDLTQNVLVKVYRQAGELRDTEHFYGWLFATARHEMISYWRRQSQLEKVETERLSQRHAGSLFTEPEVMPALHLMDLLKALEPAERDLVVLRFVEGLSYEELAVALKLPLGTVKWRIFNARKKLARMLGAPSVCQADSRVN